jgi:phenylpropionate dioxygenase-like ring-hydroxylating dioxygenase large terminal subunit
MPLDRALEELAAHAKPPPRALPAACYVDPDFWQAEVERVLRPGWHAVARVDELPKVGDFRSLDLFGEPILLVRDETRRLRAFSRVCLHRAIPIVEGEGNAKRFTCPYHRWGYDLDGRLRAAPLMDGVPGFDREACRLPELALEEWLGFALVTLEPEPRPLAPRIEALAERFATLGLADYRLAGTLEYDSPWNWKVMVENFIESYHHLGPHATNLQRTNPAAGTHAVEVEAEGVLLENPAVDGAPPFWVAQVFPTLLLVAFRGDDLPLAVWYEMRIDAIDHFLLRIHLLLPPALVGDRELVAGILESIQAVHAEDITVCEGVQRGLSSRLFRPTALAHQEATLVRFHRYLAECMLGSR